LSFNSRAVSAVAMFMAIAFAGSTSVLSYLAAVSASNRGCAGQEVLQGYRTGIADFVAWPLFSLFFVTPIAMALRSRRIDEFLRDHDVTVLEFASVRLTDGMFLVCASLFGFVALNGLMALISAERYMAISKYCYIATASGGA
jgi:hypothetical protein